jgi:hypothetical protein
MGNKSASKLPTPSVPKRSTTPLMVAGVVVVAVILGAVWYSRADSAPTVEPVAQSAAAQTPPAATPAPAQLEGPPENAKFGPHKQATLPPLPFNGMPPARPPEVTTAAYKFAAEHPEVLGYVPCYCGCERGGHRGNDDCFVTSRAPNGDVTGWEPHGMT